MQNSNYVILIDENGQPYLAHSIWDRAKSAYGSARSAAGKAYGSARSAGNRAVKYIEKIGDGAKARYFYTKDELQAYYDNMRGKANNAAQQAKQKAQKVIGITARNNADDVFNKLLGAQSRYMSAHENKNGQYTGSRYQAEYKIKDAEEAKAALDRVKAEQSAYVKSHPIITTKKAQEQYEQIKNLEAVAERASRDAGRAQARAAMDKAEYMKARMEYENAVSKYLKTPLGALDLNYSGSAASKVERFITDADYAYTKVSDIVDVVKESASSLINKTLGRDTNYLPEEPVSPDALYATASKAFQALVDAATLTNVAPKTVVTHDKPLSERKIISRISGGDTTKGSCSSLALTYIANKAGYDVLDFRGGESLELFSRVGNIKKIADLAGGNSHVITTESAIDGAKQTLQFVENGKEYYFAAGAHAAIIKKDGDKLYYLELQNPYPDRNGWQTLNETALTNRFNCRFSNSHGVTSVLIDTSSLANNKEFVSLLEYINTAEEEQKKGRSGSVK